MEEHKHVHYTQENIYGDKYDIHDNPGAVFNFGGNREERHREKHDEDIRDDEGMVYELSKFFFGEEEEVRTFLKKIMGAKPTDVTNEVNLMIKAGKISNKSCLKPLWEVMSKYGLYERSYQNWTSQIKC